MTKATDDSLWGVAAGDPVPERHADRIIATMLRDLAQDRCEVSGRVIEIWQNSKDGGPRAQTRMAARMKKAGALATFLETGKRGRYDLMVLELVGWDPARDSEIRRGEPIPEKPWLALFATTISDRGQDLRSSPVIFITHHAVSRCAQRFILRTRQHIEGYVKAIWSGVVANKPAKFSDLFKNVPFDGWRIPIAADAVIVLKKHEKREALVVPTILWQ